MTIPAQGFCTDGRRATLTLESRRALELAVGQRAVALIKASHVILALE
ncbi:MAG TPA: TOBE domain-containing protein [Caulobacteraceae bacterium]|jgi:molybdopterin-binding protein|nr:TOBE domain-containing protein [Caulobacteraceae bacterium]